jgi:hypothetical protein
MNTGVRTSRIPAFSPRSMGRSAGALWLMCIVTSLAGVVLILPMVVRTDAAATAANIMAKEFLFRLGAVSNLLSGASYVGVTVLLYYLLKPVNKVLSSIAASFGLIGLAIGATTSLANFIALPLLHRAQYSAFTTNQLQAVSLFAVTLAEEVFNVGMIFFGIQCFVVGYLIVRSTFLPRGLGRLLATGGAIYVVVSLLNLLGPTFGATVKPIAFIAAILGEGSLTAWLLVRGVDQQRWIDQANETLIAG